MSASYRGPDAAEIARKRARKLQDVCAYAPRHEGTFRRAFAGRSLRAAVDAICIECFGYEAGAVKHCTSPACPLYPYRRGCRERGKR